MDRPEIRDADSHVMETFDMLAPYADDDLIRLLEAWRATPAGCEAEAGAAALQTRKNAASRNTWGPEIMATKSWDAVGAIDREERSDALDSLGFSAQVVFGTLNLFLCFNAPVAQAQVDALQRGTGTVLAAPAKVQYERARAFNLAMGHFCAADQRLYGAATVPLLEPQQSLEVAADAIEAGCKIALVSTVPPNRGVSPTHGEFDPLWGLLENAQVPVALHVGLNLGATGGHSFVPPAFRRNGHDRSGARGDSGQIIDHLGYLTLGAGPSLWLSTMALEGVFERFPGLRCICAEQGAAWVPSWLHQLDLAVGLAQRALSDRPKLAMRPSDYIRRQVVFTPMPDEPVDWILDQVGDEMLCFSSDYPHAEGGVDPVGAFDAKLQGASSTARRRFFGENLSRILG